MEVQRSIYPSVVDIAYPPQNLPKRDDCLQKVVHVDSRLEWPIDNFFLLFYKSDTYHMWVVHW
jgi:hypothetical protein